MKETIKGHIQNYFDIYHGKKAFIKDMPQETHIIVYQHLEKGEAIGQYTLPGIRPEGDMLIWIPQRVNEREKRIQQEVCNFKKKLDFTS